MIIRYVIAVVGAFAITIGLFMFMDDVTERWMLRDPVRYFQIMDFIPAPARGRERIERPTDPRLAPEVPDVSPLIEGPKPGEEGRIPPVRPPAEGAETGQRGTA
jgi:hypothetical protein